MPLEPGTGEIAWLAAVRSLLTELAAAFGPDLIVSQHGCDSHAWDPLAHLRVTTTAMGEAARLVDALAHRHAGGRWLATGGGGYDVYRVVPRAWSLVWLAGAHQEVPMETPAAWRMRWAAEAGRYGQAPLPITFDDQPNAGLPFDATQLAAEDRSRVTADAVRRLVVPRLLREAVDRGWWSPHAEPPGMMPFAPAPSPREPSILPQVEADAWSRLTLAPRVIPPIDVSAAHSIVLAALLDGAAVSAAVEGTTVIGLVLTRHADDAARSDLLAIGVAPGWRRAGLATSLLATRLAWTRPGDVDHEALITVAERDPIDPLDIGTRAAIARRLLVGAGFDVAAAGGAIGSADPTALRGRRSAMPEPVSS